MTRTLIVSHYVPAFPASGALMRDYCLAREMAKRYEVTFLLPDYGQASRARAEPLRAFCQVEFFKSGDDSPWPFSRRLLYSINRRVPVDRAWRLARREPANVLALERLFPPLRARLASLDWQAFDLLQVEHSNLGAALSGVAIPVPAVLDWHNVYSAMQARRLAQATGPMARLRARYELRRARRSEKEVAQQFGHSVAVSQDDAAAIRALHSRAKVNVVPNGVDCDYFNNPEPGSFEPKSLVFTGALDYEPNEEAVLFFCQKVLPHILQEEPEVKFTIVGQRPPATVQDLEKRYPGIVHVTGHVYDVRPYVRRAAVSIVPLLNGGGTRLKILEALAMKKPVVSTSVGAEGLGMEDGREIIIADEPRSFARAILSLLADREMSQRLADTGHHSVKAHFDWQHVAKGLAEAWQLATEETGQTGA